MLQVHIEKKLRLSWCKYSGKGPKVGSGGRVASFFVAIAHKKGVIMCEQFEKKMNGETLSRFVRNHFPEAF
jgi:hypothetical protein